MSSAITQTAREILERHRQIEFPSGKERDTRCNQCGYGPRDCPDRVAAERIVQLAAELEAERQKIREHAEAMVGERLMRLASDQKHAEAILALLGEAPDA